MPPPAFVHFVVMGLIISGSAHANASTFTTLHNFTRGADGSQPTSGVVQDAAGNLYGETYNGGALQCTPAAGQTRKGCGTVYSFSVAAGLKTIISFSGPNGAFGGNTPLLKGTTLYASALNGGTNGYGVLFSVQTDGTAYTMLHQFSGSDGKTPAGTLQIGSSGVIFGITAAGGPNGHGVLFQLTSNGTFTILHAFTGGIDGSAPDVLLMSPSGALVGSAHYGGLAGACSPAGCGVIFEYRPAVRKFSILHSFTGTLADGGNPYLGSLGPGPAVYGISGPLFSLTQVAGYANVAQFTSLDGGNPLSGPTLAADGSLIGVFSQGPSAFNASGTLYREKSGSITELLYFANQASGLYPAGQPIITPTGSIIGTTEQGGLCSACGTIYEYTP